MDPKELAAAIAAGLAESLPGAVATALAPIRQDIDALKESAAKPPVIADPVVVTPPAAADVTAAESPREKAMREQLESLTEAVNKSNARDAINERTRRIDVAVESVKLSEQGSALVRARLVEAATRRDVTDDEIKESVDHQVAYEAALMGNRPPISRIQTGDSGEDKRDKGMQGLFLGEDVDGVPAFRSIKEAYCRWTGADPLDVSPFEIARAFSARYDSAIDHNRLRETISTATFGEVYADNLYISMLRAYRDAPYNQWEKLVSEIETVSDFQTRRWARLGGYGDLATVTEGDTYPVLTTPGDEEVSYTIAKRGGIEDMTFESIVGDRFSQLRRVPVNMGRAARRSLMKFVMNLITTDNPTMSYDSVALYDAAHGNTGAAAMTLAGVDTVTRAMRDQTAYGETDEILGPRNKPRYAVVPNELEQRAKRIFEGPMGDDAKYNVADTADTGTGMDPAAFRNQCEVIVYDYLTAAADWYAVADPREVETLVVGFLGGRREPELFVQDQPNVGANFTADKVSYKVRHIYGGVPADHRSFYFADN